MAPYTTLLMLGGLAASVAATPLRQASRSEVVAYEKRGNGRRNQASNTSVQWYPSVPRNADSCINCRPSNKPVTGPQCQGLGNFLVAAIDPAGNFFYLNQNDAIGRANVVPDQKYAVLFTVDSSCRLSSVSAPGGVAGTANQLFDYTTQPTADQAFPPLYADIQIPAGGAAITCSTGGSDGFGKYFTCYNPYTNTKDVCITETGILYFSDVAPAGCTKVQLYYSDPQ